MLEEKRRNLFWTPCTAYCIDRMLEDFAKIEYVGVCLGKSEKGHVLHSHASSVPLFDGTNYSVWHEKVEFMLGVLELDLALLTENRAELTDECTEDNKDLHKLCEKCNRLSLMFMRIKISATIKASVHETELTKDFMKSVAD